VVGGLISGTTTAVGSFNFSAQASDLNGCVKQQALALGRELCGDHHHTGITADCDSGQRFTRSNSPPAAVWARKRGRALPVPSPPA
jgi:hypothetical protein